jgi:hypothetical protein
MKKLLLSIPITMLLITSVMRAQGTENYGSGMKINLDTTGKRFIRIITWHQIWLRNNENNPGSTINGEASNSQWDMSFRRSRLLLHTQINPNFLIVTHFGINNSNQVSGGAAGQGASGADGKKPQLFLHDAYVEHRILKDHLFLGAGLHYWQGTSRLSGASTLNFMTIDSPIFSWQNVDATDQFARQFGMYAKGKLLKNKRLDYRIALNFPYALAKGNSLTNLDTTVAKNGLSNSSYKSGGQPNVSQTGYINYQFLDIESNVLPFNVGTYIGTKKVFNIGAGFYLQKNAMWTAQLNSSTNKVDTVNHQQLIFSIDAFLDLPLGKKKKSALTFYASYNHINMGKNYVRNIGINNPVNGAIASQVAFNGSGNSVPTIGTGSIYHSQIGFVFPKVNKIGRFQPYVSTTLGNYQRISDKVFIPDFGLNWFVAGHSAKITFNYRPRPIFVYENPAQKWSNITRNGTKNEFTIQMQVYL